VACSKGTYIRSLAHDFGKALNNGGHLSALRRTKIGDYSVKNAVSIEAFEERLTSL
jgi:tRNA pseudouridine55 synthase